MSDRSKKIALISGVTVRISDYLAPLAREMAVAALEAMRDPRIAKHL